MSKGWQRFLLGSRHSYTNIDFSRAARPVSALTVKTYYKRAARTAEAATLKYADETLVNMTINRLKALRELRIRTATAAPLDAPLVRAASMARQLTVLEVGCALTNAAVAGLVAGAAMLTTLRCAVVAPASRFDWAGSEPRPLRHLALTWASTHGGYPPYVSSNFVGAPPRRARAR